jgi:hypothetical protein
MNTRPSPFIETNIDPIWADLPEAISLRHVGQAHLDRPRLHGFIRDVFRRTHGAEVSVFYPNLLEFDVSGRTTAVVGYRDGASAELFAEQYLDRPAHETSSARLGQTVVREEMVEVGNLAIADPGQARWVISAGTAFLAAAGYRWVLFTATRPLANAFGRLGLKPLPLADADPDRLPDRGASWGSYYATEPRVYLGDIQAGCRKLHGHGLRRRNLRRLLEAAQQLGGGIGPELDEPLACAAGGRP